MRLTGVATSACERTGVTRKIDITQHRHAAPSSFSLLPFRVQEKSRRRICGGFVGSESLHHPERRERGLVNRRSNVEALIALVIGDRRTGQRSENAVDFTMIIALLL